MTPAEDAMTFVHNTGRRMRSILRCGLVALHLHLGRGLDVETDILGSSQASSQQTLQLHYAGGVSRHVQTTHG